MAACSVLLDKESAGYVLAPLSHSGLQLSLLFSYHSRLTSGGADKELWRRDLGWLPQQISSRSVSMNVRQAR